MRLENVRIGGFYVDKKERYVREFVRVDEYGQAHWRAWLLPGGEFAWTGVCSWVYLGDWAKREATAEEIAKLQREDAESAEAEERREMARIFVDALGAVGAENLLGDIRRRGPAGGQDSTGAR